MENHAIENAQAKLAHIVALVEALSVDFDNLNDFRDGIDLDRDDTACALDDLKTLENAECDDATSDDDIRERIQEMPPSVEMRSEWHAPGESSPFGEYRILLTWGGPACQIVGALNPYGEPESANIQYQDWGTRWESLDLDDAQSAALVFFASNFYFGG
jgi:hypothetical protein